MLVCVRTCAGVYYVARAQSNVKCFFAFLYFCVSWLMVRIDLRSVEAASTLTGLPVLRRMAMNLLRRCERTGRHDEPTTNPAHGRRTRGASKIFGVVTRRPSRERWINRVGRLPSLVCSIYKTRDQYYSAENRNCVNCALDGDGDDDVWHGMFQP